MWRGAGGGTDAQHLGDYGRVGVGGVWTQPVVSPTSPPGRRQTQHAHKGPKAFLALRTKPNDFLTVVNNKAE